MLRALFLAVAVAAMALPALPVLRRAIEARSVPIQPVATLADPIRF